MTDALKTDESVALLAVELRGRLRALADEYAAFLREPASEPVGPAKEGAAVDAKAFQGRHAAGRAAVAHMALLLKLAREIDGDPQLSEESEEDLLEEARRNLDRPA